jgi:hypothetical protein
MAHDNGSRLASFMYYSGICFTIGSDAGWGAANVLFGGNFGINI